MWTERNTEVAPIPRGGPTNAAIAAKVVDQHRGRKIRRRLLLWMMRKLIGQPKVCNNCLVERGTYQHVQECTGAYVDSAIGTGQWLEAANLIAEIEEKCLGRRTEGLRRELGEETWITELRAADRERTRPGFTGRTGQWSRWRYCAQRGEGG
jgi:hypothetical protein